MSEVIAAKLFLQDHTGDRNFEGEFDSVEAARLVLAKIQLDGGYWADTDDEDEEKEIFVPWHRVDYAKITPLYEEN